MAISAARDVVPIHRMGVRASDMFDRNNAFMARLVRQPGPLRAVADRIDAGNIATAIFVGLAMGTLVAFEIGRAHVCTSVTTSHIVCRLLLEKKTKYTHLNHTITNTQD